MMTCREALNARYRVVGRDADGLVQYAPSLSFFEAQRFFNSLIKRGFDVKAIPF